MKLGGMALRDGVLFQSERFWTAAVRRADGVKVVSGRRVHLPGSKRLNQVPVLRGVVRLGESMAVLPAVRRATGGPVLPQEDPRLLAATVASAVATFAVRQRFAQSPLLREVLATGFMVAPAVMALRDSRLARYHGAEHKSIAAYESDSGDARSARKEHLRCGSNLLAPMAVTTVATNILMRAARREQQPLATFAAGLISIGSAVELFNWMNRRQDHPLARALSRPGIELQRLFTTSEPTDDQLDVAGYALDELLRLEGVERDGLAAGGSPPPEAGEARPVAADA